MFQRTIPLLSGCRVDATFIITTRKRSLGQGNVFTHGCPSVHGGGSLYDVTSCLVAWSHVPSRGVSVSGPMFLRGGLCQGEPLDRDPPYGEEWAVRILLECILVMYETS